MRLIFQDKTLVQNEDYTVEYRDNINAGVGLIIFTGIGYTVKAIEPEVKVTFGNEVLVEDRRVKNAKKGVVIINGKKIKN